MFKTDNSFHACMVIMLRGTYIGSSTWRGGAPHESSISRALKQARKLKLHRLLPL